MTATAEPRTSQVLRIAARASTEALAPAVLSALMPVVIAIHATTRLSSGLAWGITTATFTAVIPYAFLAYGVRRGSYANHHIPERAQRHLPLLVGITSVSIGLTLLLALHAPRKLVAIVVAMFALLVLTAAITRLWKVSAHAAVATGSAAVLTIEFGAIALIAWVLAALVGWSRIHLGDHTTAQVLTGSLLAAVLAVAVYLPLR